MNRRNLRDHWKKKIQAMSYPDNLALEGLADQLSNAVKGCGRF